MQEQYLAKLEADVNIHFLKYARLPLRMFLFTCIVDFDKQYFSYIHVVTKFK